MRIYQEVLGNRSLVTDSLNTLSGPDFPSVPVGWGVIGMVITLTSASFSIQNLSRIRVRAGEFLAMDINPVGTYDYYPNWLNRFANFRGDSITDASTATSLYLPFNLFDRYDDNDQDICQLPRGRALQLELQIIGTPTNPTCHVALHLSNQTPALASQLIGWVLNVGASAVNGQPNVAPTNGILRAIGLPNPAANNPTRWKVTHSRSGELYQGSPLGLIASQRLETKFTDTTVIWLPIGDDNGLPTGPSELALTVDTGSTALTAVEAALWQLIPMVA